MDIAMYVTLQAVPKYKVRYLKSLLPPNFVLRVLTAPSSTSPLGAKLPLGMAGTTQVMTVVSNCVQLMLQLFSDIGTMWLSST